MLGHCFWVFGPLFLGVCYGSLGCLIILIYYNEDHIGLGCVLFSGGCMVGA